jgi:hypothetical protein
MALPVAADLTANGLRDERYLEQLGKDERESRDQGSQNDGDQENPSATFEALGLNNLTLCPHGKPFKQLATSSDTPAIACISVTRGLCKPFVTQRGATTSALRT